MNEEDFKISGVLFKIIISSSLPLSGIHSWNLACVRELSYPEIKLNSKVPIEDRHLASIYYMRGRQYD
jgi:hypothetical protein